MKHWRRLTVLAVASPILLIVEVGSAHVARADAQSAPLYSENGRSSCPDGGQVGDVHGFAVLSDAKQGEGLSAEVSLSGAAPNHTFTVHLIECQGGSDLPGSTTIGTFVTDGDGNGAFSGDHVEKRAAARAFVGLDGGPGQIYATPWVPI